VTATITPLLTEAQWMTQVIDYAHLRHWYVAHIGRAQTPNGRWLTPVQADGKGFPDLLMVRDTRMVVAELKAKRGYATSNQRTWLELLDHVTGVEAFLWRPNDFQEVREVLA